MKFLYENIFYYDIVSCHPSILQFFKIPVEGSTKLERNIDIGRKQKNNPNLTDVLRGITSGFMGRFKTQFNLKEEEIVLEQYDGIFLTRRLGNIPLEVGNLRLELRTKYDKFLFNISRKAYMAKNETERVVKGFTLSDGIKDVLLQLLDLNFIDKYATFQGIEDVIKNFKKLEPKNFLLPDHHSGGTILYTRFGKFSFPTNPKELEVDIDIVDKNKYLEFLNSFIRPIILIGRSK